MTIQISNQKRATLVGVCILLAYSMLTYSITKSVELGLFTDVLSGLAVIGIPILMFPIFNKNPENKKINYAYISSRFIEGLLMIIGGIILLIPALENYREFIYSDIHIYFFITGSVFFYALLYQTKAVPNFISIWGIVASILFLLITIIQLFTKDYPLLMALVIPLVLNELFLAFWLMIKGFSKK